MEISIIWGKTHLFGVWRAVFHEKPPISAKNTFFGLGRKRRIFPRETLASPGRNVSKTDPFLGKNHRFPRKTPFSGSTGQNLTFSTKSHVFGVRHAVFREKPPISGFGGKSHRFRGSARSFPPFGDGYSGEGKTTCFDVGISPSRIVNSRSRGLNHPDFHFSGSGAPAWPW